MHNSTSSTLVKRQEIINTCTYTTNQQSACKVVRGYLHTHAITFVKKNYYFFNTLKLVFDWHTNRPTHQYTDIVTYRVGCPEFPKVLSRNSSLLPALEIYFKSHQKKIESFLININQWPSIFRNTKEIPKNTKKNRYQFCFGHNFFTNAATNLNPWQVICIFIDLSIDTQLGHNYSH